MKKLLASLIILLGAFSFSFAKTKINKEFVIVIQAGHGGTDKGAVAKNGVTEKDMTLAYAKELQKIADANNFKVIMLRENDEYVDFDKRDEFLQQNKADVFICIHFNADPINASKRGFECYVGTQNNTMQNKVLGKFMGAELYTVKGMKFNGVNNPEPIAVVNTIPSPVAYLNLGYMSNDDDMAFIESEANKKEICQKVLNAIMSYKMHIESN